MSINIYMKINELLETLDWRSHQMKGVANDPDGNIKEIEDELFQDNVRSEEAKKNNQDYEEKEYPMNTAVGMDDMGFPGAQKDQGKNLQGRGQGSV